MKPTYLVSILDGIRRRVSEGVRVEYAEGADPVSAADLLPGPPLVPSSVLIPAGSGPEVHGLHAEYWKNARFEGEPRLVRTDRQVNFTVVNTGSRVGAEVAQVHLGLPASTGEPPKRLVGWAKVKLEPGETREVSVTLDPNATSRPLSYWNTSAWEMASGDYWVYVGASSRDIRLTGSLRVHHAEKQ